MTANEWIAEFAGKIGADAPDQERFDALLKLAAVAAHASERTAAPLACYLAGQSDRSIAELISIAEKIE